MAELVANVALGILICALCGLAISLVARIIMEANSIWRHKRSADRTTPKRTATAYSRYRPDFALQYHDNRTVVVMHTMGNATRMDAASLMWCADEMRKYATAIETMNIVLDTHEVQAEEQLPARTDEQPKTEVAPASADNDYWEVHDHGIIASNRPEPPPEAVLSCAIAMRETARLFGIAVDREGKVIR